MFYRDYSREDGRKTICKDCCRATVAKHWDEKQIPRLHPSLDKMLYGSPEHERSSVLEKLGGKVSVTVSGWSDTTTEETL